MSATPDTMAIRNVREGGNHPLLHNERKVNEMKINDKRETNKNLVFFKELDIGEVYEDEDGYICIKTSYANDCLENNCIAFQGGDWIIYHQDSDSKVVKVEAELVLRRNK